MNTPKPNSEHKGVEILVFLRLEKVHDRALQSVRLCIFKLTKGEIWQSKTHGPCA